MSFINLIKNNFIKAVLIINLFTLGREFIHAIQLFSVDYREGVPVSWVSVVWPSSVVFFSILGLLKKKWASIYSIAAAMIIYALMAYLSFITAVDPMEQGRNSGAWLDVFILLNLCLMNMAAVGYAIKSQTA